MRSTRRPQFKDPQTGKNLLSREERKLVIADRVDRLYEQIDLYTSRQNIQRKNIRFLRKVETRVDQVTENGHIFTHKYNQYHAIIRIAGKYYLGQAEYGSNRSKKLARHIALERALFAALRNDSISENEVEKLRFSNQEARPTVGTRVVVPSVVTC